MAWAANIPTYSVPVGGSKGHVRIRCRSCRSWTDRRTPPEVRAAHPQAWSRRAGADAHPSDLCGGRALLRNLERHPAIMKLRAHRTNRSQRPPPLPPHGGNPAPDPRQSAAIRGALYQKSRGKDSCAHSAPALARARLAAIAPLRILANCFFSNAPKTRCPPTRKVGVPRMPILSATMSLIRRVGSVISSR